MKPWASSQFRWMISRISDSSRVSAPDILSIVGLLELRQRPDLLVKGLQRAWASRWRVNGSLDAKYLAFLTGGGVPAGTFLQTNVCAGKSDGLPYQLSVVGQAAKSDTSQTSRTFIISSYNEHITITVPQM